MVRLYAAPAVVLGEATRLGPNMEASSCHAKSPATIEHKSNPALRFVGLNSGFLVSVTRDGAPVVVRVVTGLPPR